jgi:hypothetical protein
MGCKGMNYSLLKCKWRWQQLAQLNMQGLWPDDGKPSFLLEPNDRGGFHAPRPVTEMFNDVIHIVFDRRTDLIEGGCRRLSRDIRGCRYDRFAQLCDHRRRKPAFYDTYGHAAVLCDQFF